ncbi:MAG: type II toxin-antitoxin system RelE/ParE family toxin [Clostridiales bacterium]|nr:type II toxin-antitoxin system RelE/ParE family toxin [Clostridiales bacterium]
MEYENYKCLITPQAIEDIEEALAYITNEFDNEIAAKKLFDKITETVDRIALFPRAMPKVKNDGITLGKEYRRADVDNFVLIYKIEEKEKEVRIMAAFYGPSDVISRLLKRL